MAYEKQSFLAGIAVGRQLKGWATGASEGGITPTPPSPEPGPVNLTDITVRSGPVTFIEETPEGFDGIGTVTVLGDENLAAGNIKKGVVIFGITGAYQPSVVTEVASVTLRSNGTFRVDKPANVDGMSRVNVTVQVPTSVNNEGTRYATPGTAPLYVRPSAGFTGLSEVVVMGDSNLVAGNIRNGTKIFGITGTYGNTFKTQAKYVTPRSYTQDIVPDSGYNGLNLVRVYGDSDLIASNIRVGVTIFGVEGVYDSGKAYQTRTVTPNRYGFSVVADAAQYEALAKVNVNGDSRLRPENIKHGVTIFGETGTYVGDLYHVTLIPSAGEQYVVPEAGHTGFSAITVKPAEYTIWHGTAAEYDDLEEYDENMIYALEET